jgi:WD40 repeat protein
VDPSPKRKSGSWTGFLFFVGLAFAAVAGGGWYFGREYLPDLSHLFAVGNKENVKPDDPHERDDKGRDQLFEKGQPQARRKPNAAKAKVAADNPDIPAAKPDRIRANSFPSAGGPELLQGPQLTRILDLAFAPDGTELAAFDEAGTAILWDVQTGQGIDISPGSPKGWSKSEGGRHVEFSSDGKTLVVGTSSKFAAIDVAAAQIGWQKGDDWGREPLLVSPGARTVALVEKPDLFETRLSAFRVADGRLLLKSVKFDDTEHIALSPDGKLMAVEDTANQKLRLFDLAAGNELAGIPGAAGASGMMFTPDSRMLVLPAARQSVQFWDVGDPTKPKLARQIRDELPISSRAFLSPDGKTLVTGNVVWDIGRQVSRGKITGDLDRFCAFSGDSRIFVGTSRIRQGLRASIVVASGETGETLTVLEVGNQSEFRPRRPTCVAVSHDGSRVAVGGFDGSVVVLPVSSGTSRSSAPETVKMQFTPPDNLAHLFGESGEFRNDTLATDLSFSQDGNWLVTRGRWTTLWNLRERRQQFVLTLFDGRGKIVNPPDKKWHADQLVADPQPLTPLRLNGWGFGPNGKTLCVSCSGMGDLGSLGGLFPGEELVYYDLASGMHLHNGKDPACDAIKASADGLTAIAWFVRGVRGKGNVADELVVLDTTSGSVRKSLFRTPHLTGARGYDIYGRLAISPDGRVVAATTYDRNSRELVLVWDAEAGQERPTTAKFPLDRIELAEQGRALVTITGGADGGFTSATVFDVETGGRRHDLDLTKGHTVKVQSVAFAPVESMFASADAGGMVLLRDLTTGDVRARFKGDESAITAIGFSSDGARLATAAKDRTVKLWDVPALFDSK